MIIGNAMPAVVSSLFVLGAMPSGLTDLLLIFLISLTIRSGKTQRESQLFTVICMIFLVHQIMITVAAVIGSPPVILRLLRMSHTMVLFLLPVSVHFMHQTLKLPHKKKAVPAMYGVSLFLLAFVFTDHYMTMKNGFPSAGPLFHVFILISVVCLVVYGVIVLNFVRKTGHPNHTKSLYIFFGLGPTLLLTLWDSLPMFGIPAIFMGGFVFIPMGIYTYGILRHGILDNHGWFSMGYIPNFLTALVWLPLVMTVVLFAATRETLFYPDIVGRI